MIHALPFQHDETPLLVTVDRDEDGCVVTRVTAADSKHCIAHLFSKATLDSMAECIDAQLTRDALQENAEARAERSMEHYA